LDEEVPDETQAAPTEDLPQYVLKQIACDLKPAQRPIAAYILTNLNEDGLLAVPVVEVARFHHVLPSQVNAVLDIIRRADPIGVGSTSAQEALLVQLQVLSETMTVPVHCEELIRSGLGLLSRRRYPDLARMLKISVAEVQAAAVFISENLNPFPARAHWGDTSSYSHTAPGGDGIYRFPDIIITRLTNDDNSPLVIEIAMPISGTLRVNPLFKEAIRQAPAEKAEQWKSDLDQATLLVKCIQQRNHTIVRLMQNLSHLQREFILHGDAHLQPITRAQLSRELDVHESTISRAVSDKAVQLPNGHIIPLAMFFDRSLHIRSVLKQIIEEECQPLSDTEIGERLAEKGFPVARRTVAKYRSIEGILPAHLRKPNPALAIPMEVLELG
jgi:RNA polymerase sigma-54 factor